MKAPGAERFLNCVMHRSQSDAVVLVAVILLVVLGTPSQLFYTIYSFYSYTEQSFDLIDLYTMILFMGIIATFVLYKMVKSLTDHHARDVEWTGSLTEYAESCGKDVTELRAIGSEISAVTGIAATKTAQLCFIVVFFFNMSLAIFYAMSFEYHEDVIYTSEVILLTLIQVDLCLSTLYVYHCFSKLDALQCRFTEAFSEIMSEGDRLKTLSTGIRQHKLWIHAALMIVTLGIYALPFMLWTVHTQNVHILSQWDYETDLLHWMGVRDGAKGIEAVPTKGEASA